MENKKEKCADMELFSAAKYLLRGVYGAALMFFCRFLSV